MKIANSTWSLHRMFSKKKMTVLEFPEFCKREFGIYALEIVDGHLKSQKKDYLNQVKRAISAANSVLTCIPIGNDFTLRDEEERKKQIENVREWIEVADYLNCPVIRVNGGGKDDKDKDALERVISSIKSLIPQAERAGIRVTMENHGGMSSNPEVLVKVVKEVNSKYYGTLPDFGNFPDDIRYQALEKIAPYAFHVHAKSYEFDERGEETKLDYKRILDIFKKIGYQGYLSIEFEGKGDEVEGVRKTLELIKRYLAQLKIED